MPLPLSEIFPDEDYRFHLTLRKGTLTEFFGRNDATVLAERARWLRATPQLYADFRPEAAGMLSEFEVLAADWLDAGPAQPGQTGAQRVLHLGERLEADFLLLNEKAPHDFRLEAGVVCFPSSWNPAEKFGLGLEAIHGVVPRLNPSLGATIGQFLQKLRAGSVFERANWGLAATAERNLHPGRNSVRLTAETPLSDMWVRVEDQLLARLPRTQGILFGIRLRILPLKEILANEALRHGLLRALSTMPHDVSVYKGLNEAIPAVLAQAHRI